MVDDKGSRPERKGRKGRPAARQRAPGGGGGGAPDRRREDPGWESELRAREEEVAAYEERILVREFMQRLAFNTGKVRPWKLPKPRADCTPSMGPAAARVPHCSQQLPTS